MKHLITLIMALFMFVPAVMAANSQTLCNDAMASMTEANKLKVIIDQEHRIFKGAKHDCSVGKLVIKTDAKKYVVVGKSSSKTFAVYHMKR